MPQVEQWLAKRLDFKDMCVGEHHSGVGLTLDRHDGIARYYHVECDFESAERIHFLCSPTVHQNGIAVKNEVCNNLGGPRVGQIV